ncbi:MAG: FMN-binding protein [Treponema sp.]|nr:FMN-binding protein [Treponema sp.]
MRYKILLFAGLVLAVSCTNLKNIAVNSPDLSNIADGIYRGKSKVHVVRVTLDVTMQDGAISSIQIIQHFNGRGKKAEAIVPQIIEAQSLNVDVVSGATGSSKAILKAVENALAADD